MVKKLIQRRFYNISKRLELRIHVMSTSRFFTNSLAIRNEGYNLSPASPQGVELKTIFNERMGSGSPEQLEFPLDHLVIIM